MCRLRNRGALILTLLLGTLPGLSTHAQTLPIQPAIDPSTLQSAAPAQVSMQQHAVASIAYAELPDAPGEQTTDAQTTAPQTIDPQTTAPQSDGSISGTVLDAKGAEVAGAVLTLEIYGSKNPGSPENPGNPQTPRTMATSGDGSFQFDTVEAGTFKLTVASPGFATWVSPALVLQPGQRYEMQSIVLQVARADTNVDVVFTQYDLAEEQIHLEEKQRVLGVIPNFYVSYVWNAAPLTKGQKFKLAFRSELDPISFAGAAFSAGIEQWQNDYRGYDEGAQGYFTRMAASYGDGFTNTLIAGAILPSILHQDPRYFYKGTGSIRSRALYAMLSIVICKGDNGQRQVNYSNVLGNFASGALSNSYYPPANRGVGLTLVNATLSTASGAINNLLQEFLIKKISRGVQP